MQPHSPPGPWEKSLGHQRNTAAQGGRLPKMHKSTTISAQTPLLPSSQPTSWPPARGNCRDITPWPSTSSTPGDAGCEERSVTGPSTTSLPSTTSPSPTGTGTLPALPENRSQKASRFTRAPREGRHPPRQVCGLAAFLPVLHRAPAPRNPLHHPLGRQGGGTTISRAIKYQWYFPCSIKTGPKRAVPNQRQNPAMGPGAILLRETRSSGARIAPVPNPRYPSLSISKASLAWMQFDE